MKRQEIKSLEFNDLSLRLENREEILSHIDFHFPMNSIVWIKGESGSGKSLLIKLLNGLLMPSNGNYLINNECVNQMSFEEFLPYRLNIGYSFDFGGLINNRTIYANLTLPLEYHNAMPITKIHSHITEYMHIFDLQKVATERPSAIVGGLRKAACLARAFVLEPELLLLDDPTTGLRGEAANKLADLIIEKNKSKVIKHIFISSDDERFMKKLNPVVIEIKNNSLALSDKKVAA